MRMKKKNVFVFLSFILTIFLLIVLLKSILSSKNNSWIGEYRFEEFNPPNQLRVYVLNIYEENDVLYANLQADGFHILNRSKANVWCRGNEILLEFLDFYEEEEYNSVIYYEGDILLKLENQKGNIITTWGKLRPMLEQNVMPGEYFTK